MKGVEASLLGFLGENEICIAPPPSLVCSLHDDEQTHLRIFTSRPGRTVMGQSLMKFAPESPESKEKEIRSTVEESYKKYFEVEGSGEWEFAEFNRAISLTVEDINKKLNSTQFLIPSARKLDAVYEMHYRDKEKPLKREDFQKILEELIMGSGFTGFGSKDTLLFLFGIPLAAWFIKLRVGPKTIPNDVFLPGVTSATVYLLAKLNKI